jgi:predicted N-formylglutamate amidohydrolase
LAYRLGAPLFFSTVTRLLVDLNRSRHHRGLFSEFTRPLPAKLRQEILAEHYAPYRAGAEAAVAEIVAAGDRAVHLSAHSFTPVMRGRERRVDVGLLFDPSRPRERAFCEQVRAALVSRRGDLRVRFNQPYRGTADGFTTALRRRFPAKSYLGIEIEVNQRFPLDFPDQWPGVARTVVESVEDALTG